MGTMSYVLYLLDVLKANYDRNDIINLTNIEYGG